jgi:hypothetical protein
VVGDDQTDVEVELPAPPAPEDVEQAVVLARDHQRHALRPRGVVQSPLHLEAARDLLVEPAPELIERRRQAAQVEHHAQEERAPLGVGRVLVGLRDVGALGVEESRDRGHDSGPVLAADEQAPGVQVLGFGHLLPWTNLFTMAR